MSYSYTADRGVYRTAPMPKPQPIGHAVDRLPLYTAGVDAGMADARRDVTARGAFESHRRIASAIFGVNRRALAFSDGYLAGFSAILNGFVS